MSSLLERLAAVRLVVLDIDGVLTSGELCYTAEGELEKTFFVRDGLGIENLLAAGIEVAVLSGRGNEAARRRLEELGVRHLRFSLGDKGSALAELCESLEIAASEVLCVGDDVPDLSMMATSGVAVAVADAHPRCRRTADWTTENPGGRGAVREVADRMLEARRAGPRFSVVIPARYGSTRLPGKPLLELAGRPMILHVWDRARESGAEEVWVATDDERIAAAVRAHGGSALLTSAAHESGTERAAEAVAALGWEDERIVLNLQGDEPMMIPALLARVAADLAARPHAGIATLATPIGARAELFDENVVKVVRDGEGMALLFSRAPIPWVRGAMGDARLPPGTPFLRHLGLYGYRAGVLRRLAKMPPAPLEAAESLEQLRALAAGLRIYVGIAERAPGPGVDSAADLERAAAELASADFAAAGVASR